MRSKRGIWVMGFLALALLAAGVAALTLTTTGLEARPLATFPDRLTLAKVAFVDRDYKQAEELAREAGDRLFLARVLAKRGKAAEAREIFAAALKADPKSYEAARGMAEVSQALGQPKLAVTYWRRAADLKKDDPESRREMGLTQYRSGDAMGALAALQESLALDPNQADLSNLITQIVTGQGQNAFGGLAGPGKAPTIDPLRPQPPDPRTFIPKPRVPDPNPLLPKPGGRTQ